MKRWRVTTSILLLLMLPLAVFAVTNPKIPLFSQAQVIESSENYYLLQNRNMEVEVGFDGKQVEIESIRDKNDMSEFLSAPSIVFEMYEDNVPIWEFDLVNTISSRNNVKFILLSRDSNYPYLVTLDFHIDRDGVHTSFLIKNPTPQTKLVDVTFPSIKNIQIGTDSSDLYYALPYRGGVINNVDATIGGPYGEGYPMLFMDFYNTNTDSQKGMYFLYEDTMALHKELYMTKKGKIKAGVVYPKYNFNANSDRSFPTFTFNTHEGDWHEALVGYKKWLRTWRLKRSPANSKLEDTYLWERVFIFAEDELKETVQNYDTNNIRYIADAGGWYWDPDYFQGLGDYKVAGISEEELATRISRFNQNNAKTGLYLSPYLVYTGSDLYKSHGNDNWQILDVGGEIIYYESDNPTIGFSIQRWSPAVSEYRNHLVSRFTELHNKMNNEVLYFDIFGYSIEGANRSYNPTHGHPVPQESPLSSQIDLLKEFRGSLPDTTFVSEHLGGEVFSQYIDGSLSKTLLDDNPYSKIPINIYRFAFPEVRTFAYFPQAIVNEMDDPFSYLDKVLFNGEGINTHLPHRYNNPDVIPYVSKIVNILSDNHEAFSASDAKPLIETENTDIIANEFPTKNYLIYTFYNIGTDSIDGRLLKLPRKYNKSKITNLWNGEVSNPDNGYVSGHIDSEKVLVLRVEK